MAEEIDEGEFYRENFSAESDWEVFNAQLGEILTEWDVTNTDFGRGYQRNELFQCKWQVKSETLMLLKKEISVDYYKAVLKPNEEGEAAAAAAVASTRCTFHSDLMSQLNNFGPPLNKRNGELHTLARIYGLRRYIVIHPLKLQSQYFTKTAEFNFFLSAANVVAAEVGCAVPIFVQIHDPKWNFFVGVGLAPALRTNFDLVGLAQAPSECRHLSGLLTLFKEKLPAAYVQPAMVSVRTTYAMETMRIRIPMHVPFANRANTEDIAISGQVMKLAKEYFHALPSGYFPDSCTEWYAVFTWPQLSENIAIDSELRTDFVPAKAPFGNMYLSVQASSYLSSCLHDYQKLATSTQSLESLVGRNFSGTSSGAEAANPLDQLTQPKLAPRMQQRVYDSSAISNVTRRLPGPMNENELTPMLAYLFPEMYADMALMPYEWEFIKNEHNSDSLINRLGSLLANCNAHFGGSAGLAQLWAAFTRMLRFLWDNCINVPGVAPGYPDTRTCLLYQKLQLLNVCIERTRLQRGSTARKASATPSPVRTEKAAAHQPSVAGSAGDVNEYVAPTTENEFEDDDEFYDCDESLLAQTAAAAAGDDDDHDGGKPAGRLQRLGEQRLLEHAEEYIYIPIVQEPVPKTEDQLQEDADVMLKLGPGSGLTTQMMCTSLLSDMEAFKAANPQAVMADFIRWYSPKDWETHTDDAGQVQQALSARMLTPGNTWQSVWQQARPVPAMRQKRLFDNTNEALKVLHYLETRHLGEIYALTVLPTLQAAKRMLQDVIDSANVLPLFVTQIEALQLELRRLAREVALDRLPYITGVLLRLEALETQFYQQQCFQLIFNDPPQSADLQRQFESALLATENCAIAAGNGAQLAELLQQRFQLHNLDEQLVSKDYIIRVDGDTSPLAREQYLGPQFLRAIITGEKLRLCGAFTESTIFL